MVSGGIRRERPDCISSGQSALCLVSDRRDIEQDLSQMVLSVTIDNRPSFLIVKNPALPESMSLPQFLALSPRCRLCPLSLPTQAPNPQCNDLKSYVPTSIPTQFWMSADPPPHRTERSRRCRRRSSSARSRTSWHCCQSETNRLPPRATPRIVRIRGLIITGPGRRTC